MKNVFQILPDGMKHALDLVSFVALLGWFVKVLPAVATILTIVWTLIRIWQEPVVQRLVSRRRPES